MLEAILDVVFNYAVEAIIAVISIIVSYQVIPAIKNDLVPWLKEKRIDDIIERFVEAAEKMAESGQIEKKDKKSTVIKLLTEKGIEVTEEIDALIEAAVKELDIVTGVFKEEITK